MTLREKPRDEGCSMWDNVTPASGSTTAHSTELQRWEQERQQKLGRLGRKDATWVAKASPRGREIATEEHSATNTALQCPRPSPQVEQGYWSCSDSSANKPSWPFVFLWPPKIKPFTPAVGFTPMIKHRKPSISDTTNSPFLSPLLPSPRSQRALALFWVLINFPAS